MANIERIWRIGRRVLGLSLLARAGAAWATAAGQAPEHVVPEHVVPVPPALLRANASVYDTPAYPDASLAAHHVGRVTVEVVVAPNTPTSPLARVQSTRVVEAPDTMMANAVLLTLKDARYMPIFDDTGAIEKARSEVSWEFRTVSGHPQVIDPLAPAGSRDRTAAEIAMLDLRIVDRARERLPSEAMWNRHDTRQCPPKARAVSLYCALELATLEVTGSFDHRGAVMDDARAAMDDVTPHHPDYDHWLMGYNNDSTTTYADILHVLQVTRDRVAKRIPGPRP
jgi:hypothetical protein